MKYWRGQDNLVQQVQCVINIIRIIFHPRIYSRATHNSCLAQLYYYYYSIKFSAFHGSRIRSTST